MKNAQFPKSIDFTLDIDIDSIGFQIDKLIRSNLLNWEGKEHFFNPNTPIEIANKKVVDSFQANKIRNAMITAINH